MKCSICASPKHKTEDCDRFKRPEPTTRCPKCMKPVTAEERELHRANGCAHYNKPVVNNDSRRAD